MSATPPPVLSEGSHRGPEDGRCLMEHVSELAAEPFGELPRCTHPALAALAAQINDRCTAAGRAWLLHRAGALVGVGRGDPALTWRLVAACDAAALAGEPDCAAARRSAARATRAVRRWDRVRLPTPVALAVSLRALGDLTAAFHRAARAAGPPGSTTRDDALVALLDAAVATATRPTTAPIREDCPV